VGVAGLVAYQGLFQPTAAQQPLVLGTFLGLSALATGAGLLLPRLASRLDSVRSGVLLAAAVAMATSGAALAVATSVLMLGGAETQVLLTLLAFGTALGLVLELMVARSLAGTSVR
jgi:hypothetical protein